MMPNITRGVLAGGLVAYLAGPGRSDEHIEQRVIDGSLGQCGDLTERDFRLSIVADLNAPGLAHPEVRAMHKGEHKPIWHCSLSLKAGESLTDAQWSTVARDFMGGMGFPEDSRWVVVGHGPSSEGNEHVHIAATLVTETGERVNAWQDQPRSQRQCTRLERKYGLSVLESRITGAGTPGLSQAEVARARRTGEVPEREQVRALVRAATGIAATEAGFVAALRERGLEVRARRAPDGRVTGYAVARAGSNVWFPGGALGHDLTLDSLRRDWRGAEQTQQQWHDPKPVERPATSVKQASAELARLDRKVDSLDARGLADAAHSLSGALAVAGQTDECEQAAAIASVRGHRQLGRRAVLTAGVLLVGLADQFSDPQQAGIVRNLIRTWSAVKAAHHRMAVTDQPKGTVVVEQDQLTARQARARAAQLRIDERRQARVKNEPRIDAGWFKAHRIAADLKRNHPDAFREHSEVAKVSVGQALRIEALARELGTPMPMEYIDQLDVGRATQLERQVEFGLGPDKVREVDERLARITPPEEVAPYEQQAEPATLGEYVEEYGTFAVIPEQARGVGTYVVVDPAVVGPAERGWENLPTPEQAAKQGIAGTTYGDGDCARVIPEQRMKPAEKWVTGGQDISPGQRGKLLGMGFDPRQIDTLTKTNASLLIDGKLTAEQAKAQSLTDRAAAPKQQASGQQVPAQQVPQAPSQVQGQTHRRGA